LGPLVTAATNTPIVPAPGDYDDGEIGGMIGRGNRSTRTKPAPVPLCPPQTPHSEAITLLSTCLCIPYKESRRLVLPFEEIGQLI
jgi:hypothetical protein